jgi:hypothetical protein
MGGHERGGFSAPGPHLMFAAVIHMTPRAAPRFLQGRCRRLPGRQRLRGDAGNDSNTGTAVATYFRWVPGGVTKMTGHAEDERKNVLAMLTSFRQHQRNGTAPRTSRYCCCCRWEGWPQPTRAVCPGRSRSMRSLS